MATQQSPLKGPVVRLKIIVQRQIVRWLRLLLLPVHPFLHRGKQPAGKKWPLVMARQKCKLDKLSLRRLQLHCVRMSAPLRQKVVPPHKVPTFADGRTKVRLASVKRVFPALQRGVRFRPRLVVFVVLLLFGLPPHLQFVRLTNLLGRGFSRLKLLHQPHPVQNDVLARLLAPLRIMRVVALALCVPRIFSLGARRLFALKKWPTVEIPSL